MDSSKQIQASKLVAAPAADVYALLADPNRHSEIDGAGMLRGVEGDAGPLVAIGQTFTMNMFQDAFGPYRMINSVTALVPDARIGWAPMIDPDCELASNLGGMVVGGHTFTYDLQEVEGGTQVTETYDWSGAKDPEFQKMLPIVSEQDLTQTLDKISDTLG